MFAAQRKTSAFVVGCAPFPQHANNRGRVFVQWGSSRRFFVKFCVVVFVKWDPYRFYTRSDGPHHREKHRRRNFDREGRENQAARADPFSQDLDRPATQIEFFDTLF